MRIYFLGIAGTAMGNAALLLRALGHEVMGCDQAVYPPMSDLLRDAGIEIREGYDAERLQKARPELVVIGNAFSRGNEEVEFLLDARSIPYASLPETLRRFALGNRSNIVVTGTHGKTTTTSVAAYLLERAGLEPGYLIGGAPIDPESGWSAGRAGGPFVIEGDEYDSAFFDKRSKFIHYEPRVALVNNLEYDHADIFRDLEDVKRSFSHFLRLVPRSGFALLNADDENVQSLAAIDWTTVYRVGVSPGADLRIRGYGTTETGSRFDLVWQGELWRSVEWGMTGLFNARNAAMASLAAALATMGPAKVREFPLGPLAAFRGVRRRQQLRAAQGRIAVIEDFGHHATAIRDTLAALRSRYVGWRLVAAFEPRSNTSRLESMRGPTIQALREADVALIGAVKGRNSVGAKLMDTQSVAADLRSAGIDAAAFDSNASLFDDLKRRLAEVDSPHLVVFFTNGSFDGIIDRFAEELAAGDPPR